MKIRSVFLFLFVVIFALMLCSTEGTVDHLKFFPKRYSNYLGCFFDVTPCDRLDSVLKNALVPYFDNDLTEYGVVMKVFIKTQFSHLKKYYPKEWTVIKAMYSADKLENIKKPRLHKPKKLFFKSMDRDYKNHAYERMVADCLIGDNQCKKLIKEFKDTMLNFLELGICVGCNRHTFDWFNSIKNVLEANYSAEVHKIIIADYKGNSELETEMDEESISEKEDRFYSNISSIEILNKRYPHHDNSYEATAIECFLRGSSYCDTMIKTFKKNMKIFLRHGSCSRLVTCRVFKNAVRIAEKNYHEALVSFVQNN
ncbi:Protein of unknown function [Cotesia congregata]|uniref:Uncharacterized protein n=1 Tax=Cotesia congregata TaxID=51543 RepID=A0A8J2MSP2_COTCN|nr:Protein of unknown function [Cotesia congregata]